MGPGTCGTSPKLVASPPLRRGDGGQEKRPSSAPCKRLGGKRTPSPRHVPPRMGALPGVPLRRPPVGLVTKPRGRAHFPNVDPGPMVGGGEYPRLVGAPSLGGVKALRRGGSPSSRSAAPSRATRKSDRPFCRSWRPPGVVPVREIETVKHRVPYIMKKDREGKQKAFATPRDKN
ncbi:hypothetical protein GWK47_049700 [Chionoecetes opilio]|uniref:Uncharacterized protein n=1 Tax=Chionoecetes opilio TaxID=41210 RepID=A0A8J5CT58_CHIOP|nr:hypothetical protein GWK47_049700 [Chionoecetes opilio]